MFDYLRGKITKQFANYITVDVNGVGYKVYVSNPYKFALNEENTVYVYCHVREDENSLYGFYSESERHRHFGSHSSRRWLPSVWLLSVWKGSQRIAFDWTVGK